MPDSQLQELSEQDCERQLAANQVGRLAVIVEGVPVVVPVNYRWVPGSPPLIVVRTRPGGFAEGAASTVAFQLDGVDAAHRTGWSVLVQGSLHPLTDEVVARHRDTIDPHPWLARERDAWLALVPASITGRRLLAPEAVWAVHLRAYL